MKTSSIIAATATTLIAAGLWGGDLVRAFPNTAEPSVVAVSETAPYRWRDYWDRPAPTATAACPARKSLSLSWEGPRLTWQRNCGAA